MEEWKDFIALAFVFVYAVVSFILLFMQISKEYRKSLEEDKKNDKH